MTKCVVYDPKTRDLVEAVLRSERELKIETRERCWMPARNGSAMWRRLDERIPIADVCSIGSILVSAGYNESEYDSRYEAMQKLIGQVADIASERYDADYVRIEKITYNAHSKYAQETKTELHAVAAMYITGMCIKGHCSGKIRRVYIIQGKGPDGSGRNWI